MVFSLINRSCKHTGKGTEIGMCLFHIISVSSITDQSLLSFFTLCCLFSGVAYSLPTYNVDTNIWSHLHFPAQSLLRIRHSDCKIVRLTCDFSMLLV